MAHSKTPVLIVGAGPVGLALAGDLGWRGIACTVVERGDGSIEQPKMDMVGIRTMEFCRRWGIVEWIERAGYNRDYPQDCAWVTALHGGHELGREPFPAPRDEPVPPVSPQKRERCPQNFFDPVLARFAARHRHVTVRYRTELQRFEERSDGVTAVLTDVASGREEKIACDYLVGCDGGASGIREALEIPMSGNPALTYTTNALIRCDELEKLHHLKPAYRFIFIGPEGAWCTLVAIDGRDRWRLSIIGSGARRELGEAEVRECIVRAVGRAFDFQILSVTPWVRRQLVADRYACGRVFICGDACHVMSPTGGFGMNTGIQDAIDLAWKLEATLRGWGGAMLLRSYETERRPVALRNVAEATGNLKRMLSPRDLVPPREVFEPGTAGDAARATLGRTYTEAMRREWHTNGIHLGYRYEGSPVIFPDGTPEPEDSTSDYAQTARPGHRAPHVWLGAGRSTLDCFGKGFVLLRFEEGAATDRIESAAEAGGVPLNVVDVDSPEARDVYQRGLVLVRPDGHCAWRADKQPHDAAGVMATVCGLS